MGKVRLEQRRRKFLGEEVLGLSRGLCYTGQGYGEVGRGAGPGWRTWWRTHHLGTYMPHQEPWTLHGRLENALRRILGDFKQGTI